MYDNLENDVMNLITENTNLNDLIIEREKQAKMV